MHGQGTYCRHAEPTSRNAVPSNAVRMRKTKKAARFGERAVPMLQQKNSRAVVHEIWICIARVVSTGIRSRNRAQVPGVSCIWLRGCTQLTDLLPQTSLKGPQTRGEIPMNSI